MRKLLALVAVLVLAGRVLPAASIDSVSLHVWAKNLERAAPPRIEDGWLVLSFGGPHHFVGAAFAHEDFATIHPFQVNERGIFILAFKIPPEFPSPLTYRLVVDGSWIADPYNSRRIRLPASGAYASVLDLPRLPSDVPGVYRVLDADGRTAHFLFKAPPGEVVAVAGSFNNWNPYLHRLEETSPGVYELSLALPPGLNLYCFVWRGDLLPDPLNQEKASDRYDRVVSVLRVGPGPMPGDPVILPMNLAKPAGGQGGE